MLPIGALVAEGYTAALDGTRLLGGHTSVGCLTVSASFPTLSPCQCVDTHADSFLRPQHNWRCHRSCCRCCNPHTDCGAQADLHIQGTTQAVHVCLHWIRLDMHACTDQAVSSQGFPPTEKKPETHKQALKPNQPQY
jgi:hypothetical protein